VGNTIIKARGTGRYIRFDPWSWLSLHRVRSVDPNRGGSIRTEKACALLLQAARYCLDPGRVIRAARRRSKFGKIATVATSGAKPACFNLVIHANAPLPVCGARSLRPAAIAAVDSTTPSRATAAPDSRYQARTVPDRPRWWLARPWALLRRTLGRAPAFGHDRHPPHQRAQWFSRWRG
jgi:hypothetical protein